MTVTDIRRAFEAGRANMLDEAYMARYFERVELTSEDKTFTGWDTREGREDAVRALVREHCT